MAAMWYTAGPRARRASGNRKGWSGKVRFDLNHPESHHVYRNDDLITPIMVQRPSNGLSLIDTGWWELDTELNYLEVAEGL